MRLLNLLGVEIGPPDDLLAPVEADNTRGYWEPRWLVELNDEILAKLGTAWGRPFPAERGWEQSSEFDELRERARGLLADNFGAAPLWGFKDPRTALTLPLWKQLLPSAKYVICLRNPADAISSIQRRSGPQLSLAAWSDLWLEYTALALMETDGCPRTLVFYEDYFHDAQRQLAAIAATLGLPTTACSGAHARATGEISRMLRHHSTSPRELAATGAISPAARTLFLALRAAEYARRAAGGANGRAQDDCAETQMVDAIGRVGPDLWWEHRMLASRRDELEQARQTTATLRDERENLRDEAAQTRAHASELHALLERVRQDDEVGRAHRELEDALDDLHDTRCELAVSFAHCDQAQTALSEIQGRFHRQSEILEFMRSSISWRVTAPLRAAKRLLMRMRPCAQESLAPARDESLLAGMSVAQVSWFALALCALVADTDAILTHVVLITLLAAGPFCGLLTGRWTRTAMLGLWAVALGVILSIPDRIWDTRTQLVDVSIVLALATLSTVAASIIERSRAAHQSNAMP